MKQAQSDLARRSSRAFVEQKRRDQARPLKEELAETRARLADYFYGLSVVVGLMK